MDKNIRLHKTVKEQEDLRKVISNTFTTFVQPQTQVDTDTVSELFRLYDKLYLQIPIEGPNSHTYLIEESSKLVEVQEDNTVIQPLLDEITELRERLLSANEQIFELEEAASRRGNI